MEQARRNGNVRLWTSHMMMTMMTGYWTKYAKLVKPRQYKNRNISKNYKTDQDQIWGPSWYRQLHFEGGLMLPISNPIWLPAAILWKWIWRRNSADDHRITTRFGRQMQNGMPMTTHISKSKPEIEWQYGGRPFSETGSSYISAVDWATSSKFGTQIAVSYTHLTLPTNREV